jgi:hypothetical protein
MKTDFQQSSKLILRQQFNHLSQIKKSSLAAKNRSSKLYKRLRKVEYPQSRCIFPFLVRSLRKTQQQRRRAYLSLREKILNFSRTIVHVPWTKRRNLPNPKYKIPPFSQSSSESV